MHDGGYRGYLDGREARVDASDKAETVRKNLARREKEWLLRGAPARTSKAKARIRTAEAIQESGVKRGIRDDGLALHSTTPRLGNTVIELSDIRVEIGDRVLVDGFTIELDPRERLGIVGPNGTGKSTLLDTIALRREPASGSIRHGSTVRLSYFDQLGHSLDPSKKVIEMFTEGSRDADWRDKLLLERFWFDAATQYSPIEQLSGGERRRLQLVLTLAEEPNVLLLDEPTNDLDLDTLRALEDFLEDFPGAVVAVSHDRAFLERVVDDVIVVDESTTVGRVPGGFEAWLETRRSNRRKGHASTRSGNNSAASKGVKLKTEPGTASGASKSTLRHHQKETEKLIRKADKAVVALTTKLADAADHATMASLGTELSEAQAELDTLEEQWMETSLELEG